MIFLEMSGRRRCFSEAFQIKYDKLLEIYKEICSKVSIIVKKEVNSKPVESKNNLKIEIKLYEGEANTFYVMLKCQKKFVVLLVINNIN